MIKIQFRRKPAPPIEPQQKRPKEVGAYRYTLRSVPRHHDEIREVIERRGGSRVYFSEPLAYLRGQGISLFRVESREIDYLEDLYAWWAQKERDEAFPFDINLFFNDREWVASLREQSPAGINKLIEDGAPRTTEEDLLAHYDRPKHN